MRRRTRTDTALTLGGAVGLLVGSYFALFRRNPRYEGDIPDGYVHELSDGLHHVFDGVLLGLAGLVVVLLVVDRFDRPRAIASAIAGAFAAGFALQYLLVSARGPFAWPLGVSEPFVPALGWYALVIGGIALLAAGGLRLIGLAGPSVRESDGLRDADP